MSLKKNGGFTLIEMSVVLLIISLIVAGSLSIGADVVETTRFKETQEQLDVIEDAINDFYDRNGRFPCPASLTDARDVATYGVEGSNCDTTPGTNNIATNGYVDVDGVAGTTNVRIGALPVRALSLPLKYMNDKWKNRFTYAVVKDLARTAALAAANDGDIAINDGIVPTSVITPANEGAWVVVSHGSDSKGAYIASGSTSVATACDATGDALDEENCNEDSTFTSARFNNGDVVANFFDDMVVWGMHAQDTKDHWVGYYFYDADTGAVDPVDLEAGDVSVRGGYASSSANEWLDADGDDNLTIPEGVTKLEATLSIALPTGKSCWLANDNGDTYGISIFNDEYSCIDNTGACDDIVEQQKTASGIIERNDTYPEISLDCNDASTRHDVHLTLKAIECDVGCAYAEQ